MDSKVLSDVACGVFRLRKDDPHMTNSTIVDVHDDDYTTLTTVEVRNGTVVLHCITSWEKDEEEDEAEEEDSDTEEASGDEAESEDEDEDEDDSEEDEEEDPDDEKAGTEKTYTVASGNSVTIRALAVRLAPVGMETAEGTYQVQMMKSVD